MSGILSDFGYVLWDNAINLLLIGLVAPIIVNVVKSKYLSDVVQRKSIVKKSIMQNKYIKNCFDSLEGIGYKSHVSSLRLLLPFILSACIFIFIALLTVLFAYLLSVIVDFKNQIFIQSLLIILMVLLISLVPLTLTNRIAYYWKEEIDKKPSYLQNHLHPLREQLFKTIGLSKSLGYISNYKRVNFLYELVTVYSFTWVVNGPNFINVIYNNTYFSNYKVLIIGDYLILYIFVFLSIIVSFLSKKEFTKKVKEEINDKYKEFFPIVRISTIGGHEVTGRIEYAFIDDSISLVDGDCKTTIICSSVDMITIEK